MQKALFLRNETSLRNSSNRRTLEEAAEIFREAAELLTSAQSSVSTTAAQSANTSSQGLASNQNASSNQSIGTSSGPSVSNSRPNSSESATNNQPDMLNIILGQIAQPFIQQQVHIVPTLHPTPHLPWQWLADMNSTIASTTGYIWTPHPLSSSLSTFVGRLLSANSVLNAHLNTLLTNNMVNIEQAEVTTRLLAMVAASTAALATEFQRIHSHLNSMQSNGNTNNETVEIANETLNTNSNTNSNSNTVCSEAQILVQNNEPLEETQPLQQSIPMQCENSVQISSNVQEFQPDFAQNFQQNFQQNAAEMEATSDDDEVISRDEFEFDEDISMSELSCQQMCSPRPNQANQTNSIQIEENALGMLPELVQQRFHEWTDRPQEFSQSILRYAVTRPLSTSYRSGNPTMAARNRETHVEAAENALRLQWHRSLNMANHTQSISPPHSLTNEFLTFELGHILKRISRDTDYTDEPERYPNLSRLAQLMQGN